MAPVAPPDPEAGPDGATVGRVAAGAAAVGSGAAARPQKPFLVTNYGALGDGGTLCTRAIQTAIDRCAAAGGGTVTVPAGRFLTTTVFLKSNVNLHLGQGAALQTGMEYALRQGAEIMVHFDGDGQMKVGDIPKMVEPILNRQAQVTIGSRYLGVKNKVPFTKKFFIHKPAIILNWIFTGLLLSDAHCGFRAFRAQHAPHQRHLRQRRANTFVARVRRSSGVDRDRFDAVVVDQHGTARPQKLYEAGGLQFFKCDQEISLGASNDWRKNLRSPT